MNLPFLSARLLRADFKTAQRHERKRLRNTVERGDIADWDMLADACRAATVNGEYGAVGPLLIARVLPRHAAFMLVSRPRSFKGEVDDITIRHNEACLAAASVAARERDAAVFFGVRQLRGHAQ